MIVRIIHSSVLALILVLILILNPYLRAQDIVINELMHANFSTITDEDGDYSDWFEIFNNSGFDMPLTGFGISDDPDDLFKWVFPEIKLSPQNHLLVFASDKNRTKLGPASWETVINWGDEWKYKLGTEEPPADWNELGFNDIFWQWGKSGFGFGDNDDFTVVPSVMSVYVRKVFSIADTNSIIQAALHIDYDDGFVAYLNGVEIARANIGTVGIPPLYNKSATNDFEALIYQGGKPSMFLLENVTGLFRQGDNVLAIQVHNKSISSSDLTLIPFFSLGMSAASSEAVAMNNLLEFPKTYLHTNFKLSGSEKLFLTQFDGLILDSISWSFSGNDISFGRKPDGSQDWFLFNEATPGDSNDTEGFLTTASAPQFLTAAGFYSNPIAVELSSESPEEKIYYTLDGSEPSDSSTLYTAPIDLLKTTVVRAKTYGTGVLPGKTITNTYFINFDTELTTVSLSTTPANLFDEDYGIYVLGKHASPDDPHFGANYWEDWERPVHVELFEQNTTQSFSIDAGIKIFGGWSRAFPQKSVAIFARSEYGTSEIDYKFFEDTPISEFESFVLRNSGNDWQFTLVRDGLMTTLVNNTEIDKQAFRPAVVFINAEYWGIHNIREKINEHFISSHHNIDADSIEMTVSDNGEMELRINEHYSSLADFVERNNLSTQSNYDYVCTQIDIENFIDYHVAQIYFDNTDWPGNNIKIWRSTNPGGKWRWIMFDTDFGFGLYDVNGYKHNTLAFATQANGPGWPNPPWSTLFLRKLLQNQLFKNEFINRFCDFANTRFLSDSILAKIDLFASYIEDEMPRHFGRWNQPESWTAEVARLKTFANYRPEYMRLFYKQYFQLGNTIKINFNNLDPLLAKVKLNSIFIPDRNWSGIYFQNVPVKITAIPRPGYRFVRWEGSLQSEDNPLEISPSVDISLTPVFELDNNGFPTVVINEINYNSSPDFDSDDWIELYNNTNEAVDISGWIFKDGDEEHEFNIPQNTVLDAGEFIVLVKDSAMFTSFFPTVKNYIGDFDFNLANKGELICLYDKYMQLADSLTYSDSSPWPDEADGTGATLVLKNPKRDNSLAENWDASSGFGSPGMQNDNFTNINNNQNANIPVAFELYQNYPNPFNPKTIIKFTVPEKSNVSIQIFNQLGELVALLIQKEYYPGMYSVEFNGENLASGVYFYRMISGNFISVKKFILLK
ncbi:MAG: CotH kinase family protein [bacterium]